MDALTGLDWDDGNLAKCQKHGVSIGEIEELFRGQPYSCRTNAIQRSSRVCWPLGGRRRAERFSSPSLSGIAKVDHSLVR